MKLHAAEAAARTEATKAAWGRASEINGARAYRAYRPRIDAAIADRASKGFSTAIVEYPAHRAAADLLQMRLTKLGYRVRSMAYGRDFFIEWGEGWPNRTRTEATS